MLTIRGINFGVSGGLVLIGSALCTNVQHDSDSPHRAITCNIPNGVGVDRTVTFLTGGGGIGNTAVLSYTECVPGTNSSGLDCLPCESGRFSTTRNAELCQRCAAGTFTGQPSGASSCIPCEVGTYSAEGSSACTNCTVGFANSARSQVACVVCQPGTFSAVNGSRLCTPCGRGYYNSLLQQTTCVAATPGRFASPDGLTVSDCPAGEFSNTSAATGCSDCTYHSAVLPCND